MKNIAIIGSGSWGVALAIHLAKLGNKIKIWSFAEEEKDLIKINRNMMMMYHGSMLPINKSDKINMFIYSYSPIVDIYNINIIKKTNIIKVFTFGISIPVSIIVVHNKTSYS